MPTDLSTDIPNVVDLPGRLVLDGTVHVGMQVRCTTEDGREHVGFVRETHLRLNGDAGYSVSYARRPETITATYEAAVT